MFGVAITLLAGCRATEDERPPDPVRPPWRWRLCRCPGFTGSPHRARCDRLRGSVVFGWRGGCAGRRHRPAAWRSTDGRGWVPLPLRPKSYYGERAILYAVGCHEGRIAVIGARSGGAHGNPRVRTWRQDTDGGLSEVAAEFELYGGPDAVSASRIAGGAGVG
ncbi:hypothetical protein NKG94_48215 [Micromonospora sp. M12]